MEPYHLIEKGREARCNREGQWEGAVGEGEWERGSGRLSGRGSGR